MNELHSICQSCLNQRVLVSTRDGRVHEGMLVNFNSHSLYLDTSAAFISNKANTKAFGFGGGILALALFDILAIALVAGGAFW
ncbi:hypothetical protein [Cohnella nanjingensis]|uniref:Uncharacterized protein n=1 Tax=Cohnella nanjingensis TaxID=1387779 RepID=A0A7X0S010_9BACL|nr:hypothetical protein [Cohnella nanjingensis]MBB6675435.1 hypothetical protein [Cohnella nanjingensis]